MKPWFLSLFIVLNVSLANAQVIEKIVAIVNEDIVTMSEVNSFINKIDKGGMVDDLLFLDREPQEIKKDKRAVIDLLINQKLMDNEVKKMKLEVTLEKVDQEIRTIAKHNGISRAELLAAAQTNGVSASEYQDFIKTRLERQSLIEAAISSKVKVSEEEVSGYYMKHYPNADSTVYEYTLAHILFSAKHGGRSGALERAKEVQKKIKSSGLSFEDLAERNSEDPAFTAGGLLGTFKAGEFSKEMEAAIRNIEVGAVSDVVETKAGFHLIKLVNKKLVADPRFEKEKEKIRGQLTQQAFKKQFISWLEQKRDEAYLKINPY